MSFGAKLKFDSKGIEVANGIVFIKRSALSDKELSTESMVSSEDSTLFTWELKLEGLGNFFGSVFCPV